MIDEVSVRLGLVLGSRRGPGEPIGLINDGSGRCGWSDAPHDREVPWPIPQCGGEPAYRIGSAVNGGTYLACVEHAAKARATHPDWVAWIYSR